MGKGGGTVSVDRDPIPTFYQWITADRQRKRKGAPKLTTFAAYVQEDQDFPKDVHADMAGSGAEKIETYLRRNSYDKQKAAGIRDPVVDKELFDLNVGFWRCWPEYLDYVADQRVKGRFA